MKKYLLVLAACLLTAGCARTAVPEVRLVPVSVPVDGKVESAAGAAGMFDVPHSPYFPVIDFYGTPPTPTLVKLDGFRTYQQTSEISCGPASAVMVFDWFGTPGVTEDALAREMDIRPPDNPRPDGSYGADTAGMVKVFRNRGFEVASSLDAGGRDGVSFATDADFARFVAESLQRGEPVLVENVTWGGHWMVIVGYDTMGTPALADDVLIFADPYDTTDHRQDGLAVKSFQRFFYEWVDAGVLPPGQRLQQYVRVRAPQAR